jgi:hypothetical protein
MVMNWLFGEKCVRCDKQRTKREYEGIPTCEPCELKLKATREAMRRCPVDGSEMSKEIIHKVILDRCPACAGIWLDRGELDIVKKAMEAGAPDNFATGFLLATVIDTVLD